MKKQLSCYIIGEDKLAIQCAEILLIKEHKILGIFSSHSAVQSWAGQREIPCFNTLSKLKTNAQPCDYLFSIVNYQILPDWLLVLPKYFAINYHDSLLPTYAGSHATSWAIINNEKQHGVSWHVMTKKVDAGDILKQGTVQVSQDETALSLNLKCFDLAIHTFSELVDELVTYTYIRKAQELSQRTFYSFKQKPSGNGWLNWNDTAENIERLFRALSFGNYTNRLGTLKIIVDNQIYIISDLKATKNKSKHSPGILSQLHYNEIRVSTTSHDVVIRQLKTVDANLHDIEAFIIKHQLKQGDCLFIPILKLRENYQQLSADLAKYENFWLSQLIQAKPVDLPFLSYEKKKKTYVGVLFSSFKLTRTLKAKLKKQFNNVDSFESVLLTTCLLYLSCLNEQKTVSVDLSSSSLLAKVTTFAPLVSSYVPFTLQFKGQSSFKDILQRVEKQQVQINKKETYLEDIYVRYPALSEAFQVMAISIIIGPITAEHFKFWHAITLSIVEDKISIYVAKELLNENLHAVLANISGHLQVILDSAADNPETNSCNIPLLTTREQQKILVKWNKTRIPYPEKTVTQLFEQQVKKIPNNIAVIFAEQQLTYYQLDEKTSQLAHYLWGLGVKAGSFVAICVERSLEMVIGLLGIVKAGGVYVPIDPEYPKDRIEYIISDTNPKIILTQEKILVKNQTVFKNRKVLLLDKENDFNQANAKLKRRKITFRPRNNVYVLYTSGSTGKPKGVVIQHSSLVSFLTAMSRMFRLKRKDTFFAITPISFDISALEIYLPLISGAKLLLANEESKINPSKISQVLNTAKVTIMQATPATWQMLVDSGWRNTSHITIISGGEALSSNLVSKLYEKDCKFYNLYGPTETTIWATAYKIEQINTSQLTPIGKPLANMQVFVLNQALQPVPIGVCGELFIGGKGVAKGYLNQPVLTKNKFIPNPLNKEPGTKLYKTGDFVRWLPDGNLEFIGRIDDQVKIRGYRVELAEIETALTKHPQIAQAVVCLREIDERKQLEAYYIKKENSREKHKPVELQDYLKQTLPVYMVPTIFLEIASFPLTFNGKIDRKALLKIGSETVKNKIIVKPVTEFENILAQTWQELLNLRELSVEDNFFALGGDSITAILSLTKLSTLGLDLAIKDIFAYQTIRQLAKHIRSRPIDEQKNILIEHQPGSLLSSAQKIDLRQMQCWDDQNTEDIYPLSPLQEGLLFQAISLPTSEAYTVQLIWENNEDTCFDLDCLRTAWQLIIERYPVLRTYFLWQKINQPVQVVQKKVHLPWVDYDWTAVHEKAIEEKLDLFLRVDRQAGFNFTSAPLLRITTIKLPQGQYLIVTFHHILLDGWSLPILSNELDIVYQDILAKRKPTLLPIVPYYNFIEWQQRQDLSSAREFWKKYLKGFSAPSDLTILHKNNTDPQPKASETSVTEQLILSATISEKIRLFCKQEQLTTNTIFQGLWGLLISRYSQNNDVTFGVTLTERTPTIAGSDKIIGLLINTLPLRIELRGDISVRDYFAQVQQNFIQVASFHYSPLAELHNWGEIPNSIPLFDNILVFENYPPIANENQLITFSNAKIIDPTHYILTCIVIPGNEIVIKLTYDKEKINSLAIKRLHDHLQTLLHGCMHKPEKLLWQISILTPPERQKILFDWNNTQGTYSINKTIPELFEEQVKKTPHHIAAVFNDQQITYFQLDQKAKSLADILCQQGVTSQMLVAMAVDPSIEMIIGILAILKAGGVYLPIDLEYPISRISSMLRICDARFFLLRGIHKNSAYVPLLPELDELDIKIIDMDDTTVANVTVVKPSAKINDRAYVVFTSGSTGTPKAAAITHKTIANLIAWQVKSLANISSFRVSQFASIGFDVSLQEIFYALLNGHELHIVPANSRKSMSSLLSFVDCRNINILMLPTSLLDLLCSEALMQQYDLQSVSAIIVAGEALKITENIRRFFTINAQILLINHYGPCETHVVTSFILPQHPQSWPIVPPIGKPIDNCKVYVLDKFLQPVPCGVIGELYIGGIIGYGYLNQEEVTKQSFIADPFTSNSRLYKTGDLVKWLDDGNLEFIGRINNQVKIRGYRIELDEIIFQIEKYPGIKQTIVLARDLFKNNKYLVAYLLAEKDIFIAELKKFLEHQLPSYMVPSAFVTVKEFPLTINGKLDETALLIPVRSQFVGDKNFVSPRDPQEIALAHIWSEVLSIKEISVHDNFFDLGGHSLTVLHLLQKIKKQFEVDLSIRTILDAPTIEQLSSILDAGRTQLTKENEVQKSLLACLVPLQPVGNKTPLFLIHPVGGTIFWYLSLAKYLGNERPIFGIQDPGLKLLEQVPFKTVEEMAEAYISIIKHALPQGPYLLGGASSGGVVSFEIARQLLRSGDDVALIALFDSWVPHPEELRREEIFNAVMRRQYNQMQENFNAIAIEGVEDLFSLQWKRAQMLDKYNINPIDAKLTLFKAAETIPVYQPYSSPLNGWEKCSTQSIGFDLIPGDHETIFQYPNVEFLAKALNNCLKELDIKAREYTRKPPQNGVVDSNILIADITPQ
jgi:amino acid adenylation domain-containing protein